MDSSNPQRVPRPDAEAWLRLCLVPGVPPSAQRLLLAAMGTPQHVLGGDARALVQAGASPRMAELLAAGPSPVLLEKTLRWLDDNSSQLITLGDPAYPRLLLQIPDPPNVLYAIGRVELLNEPCFAIVGSRNCTGAGGRDARAFAHALSSAGLCIVSGLALGIDTHAHTGGLEGAGSTIAVMGTGPDVIYPARNRELAHHIARQGCLLTEFPLGTPSMSGNFPRRNRLISGLSRGVLVVEAARRSGSLITARLAADQDRDVFAVPGSIHSPHSKGCHHLIKDGAKLVDDAADILIELGMPAPQSEGDSRVGELDEIEVRPHLVLNAIRFAPLTIDQISGITGAPPGVVAAELSRLEVEGRVESMAGGRFQLNESQPSRQAMKAPSRVIE